MVNWWRECVAVGGWCGFGRNSITSSHLSDPVIRECGFWPLYLSSQGGDACVWDPRYPLTASSGFFIRRSSLFSSLASFSPLAQCNRHLNIFKFFYLNSKNKTLHGVLSPLFWFSFPFTAKLLRVVSIPSSNSSLSILSSIHSKLASLPPTLCSESLARWKLPEISLPLNPVDTFQV